MKQINLKIYKNNYLIFFFFFILFLIIVIIYPLIVQFTGFSFFFIYLLEETINKLYITSSLLYASILILNQVIPLLIYKMYYILMFLGFLIFSSFKTLIIYGTSLITFPFLWGEILVENFQISYFEKLCMLIPYVVVIILHIPLYIIQTLSFGCMFWIQVLWFLPIIDIIPGLIWKFLMVIYTWASAEIRDDFLFFSWLILYIPPFLAQHFHKEYLEYRITDLFDSWTYLWNNPDSDEVWERGKLYGYEYRNLLIKAYIIYKIITSIIPFLILTMGVYRLSVIIGVIITPFFIICLFMSFVDKWADIGVIIIKKWADIVVIIIKKIHEVYKIFAYWFYWDIYAMYWEKIPKPNKNTQT